MIQIFEFLQGFNCPLAASSLSGRFFIDKKVKFLYGCYLMGKKRSDHDKMLEKLHQSLHCLVNKHKTLDRIPRDFGIDERLIGSEIHTISAVGENSMCNISELAKRMEVTKAAISQTIRKLQKKGYLRKLRDENNRREVLVVLTEKGKHAHQGHKSVWKKSFLMCLSDVTDEQIAAFKFVAEKINSSADIEIDENT